MVDEITVALSRFRSFAVVSRNSSFVYKDRPVDVRIVAKELGVRYVLEGSVRRAGSTLRVSAQLVEGEAGTQLWSKRYEGQVEDILAFKTRSSRVSRGAGAGNWAGGNLALAPRPARQCGGLRSLPSRSLRHAHDRAGRQCDGVHAFRSRGSDGARERHLPHRCRLDDGVARAMGWPGIDTSVQRQVELAHRAVEAAPLDGEVLARATMILIHGSREYDLAEIMIARALEANPNAFWVLTCAGIWHTHCGNLEKALHYFGRVAELSPNDLNIAHTLTGIAHVYIAMGRYAEALSWAERSYAVNRKLSATYWMLVAGNALLERLDAARHYLALLLEVAPGTTLATLRAGQPARYPDRNANIYEGLRLAGLPEA